MCKPYPSRNNANVLLHALQDSPCVLCATSIFTQLSYGLNAPVFEIRLGQGIFSSLNTSRQPVGPSSLPFNVLWGPFSGVERPKCDGDDSPPYSAEIETEQIHNSIPPCETSWRAYDKFTFLYFLLHPCYMSAGNLSYYLITKQCLVKLPNEYTVIPRLTKIIRSGITFVSRNLL